LHEIPGFKSHSGPPFIFYFSTFLLFPMASSFFRNKAHLTPDELAARMYGYVVAGLESVRKEVVGKCFNSLKGKVCTIIVECFCDICIQKGFARDKLPKDMKWAGYQDLVTKYGVKLNGWPEEGGVRNPGDFKSCAALEHLLAALDGPSCSFYTHVQIAASSLVPLRT